MCRLLAYACDDERALTELLSDDEFRSFSDLSSLHADGWGMAWIDSSASVRHERSVHRAIDDPRYFELAASPLGRAGLVHLRWATPGFPVKVENNHPFCARGWAFAHNGAIPSSERLDDLLSEETRGLLDADTDSKRYFLLVLQRIEELGDVRAGIRRALVDIRELCELGSLNAILLGHGHVAVIQMQDNTPVPVQRLQMVSGGREELPPGHDEGYYHLRYTERDGAFLISSMGMAEDSWSSLAEDALVMIGLEPRSVSIEALDAGR
jgi:predicted glutamine amidotransferase